MKKQQQHMKYVCVNYIVHVLYTFYFTEIYDITKKNLCSTSPLNVEVWLLVG